MNDARHLPAGTAASDGFDVVVTPESAQWSYSGLRVLTLPAEGARSWQSDADETLIVPLAGSGTVEVGGAVIELAGRRDVFAGATDFVYLPRGTAARLVSPAGGRFALCTARSTSSLPVRHVPAGDVAVEVRGAGPASRLVRNFATADAFEAGAVIACEVITPGGNWSSYPAHKHDEAGPQESELEEIYYYEVAAGPDGQPGHGFHRTSSSPRGAIDTLAEVHDGDTVLVPWGWHGPSAAAPGFDMYYLNVMAGPIRTWQISDHPDQAWVRGTWPDQPVDPRLVDGRFSA